MPFATLNAFVAFRKRAESGEPLTPENAMQMNLGQLIDALERMPKDKSVIFDFCKLAPGNFSCYRGYYEQLALGYGEGHTLKHPTVGVLLDGAREANGNTYSAWKGGEFKMGRHTSLWAAQDYDDCSDTMIVGVVEHDFEVVLQTEYEP